MNEQNLKPQAHVLTVEEQSRGGKKSAEVQRVEREENKKAKRLALAMADALLKNKDGKILYNQLTGEPETALAAAIYKQYEKAIKKGDTASLKLLLELMGDIKGDAIQVNAALIQRTPAEVKAALMGIEVKTQSDETTDNAEI